MDKKILVILTGTAKYPNLNRATGVWLGEVVHFVEAVEKAGFGVDYASPQGGYTPIDPHSLAMAEPIDWEWYHDKGFMNRLGTMLKPSEVDAADYAAIYFVGGHGCGTSPITRNCRHSAARSTRAEASSHPSVTAPSASSTSGSPTARCSSRANR